MASARFEIYPAVRRTEAGARPDPGPVTWRLLATNNRDLGRATEVFPNAPACVAAIEVLRAGHDRMIPVAVRADRTLWIWRIELDGEEVAGASRSYQRRVQAEHACAVFLDLIGAAGISEVARR